MDNTELQAIIERIEKGNLLDTAGEHEKALEIYIKEWNEIDQTDYDDDIPQFLAASIFSAYFSMSKYAEAKYWALESLKMNLPDYATEEFMLVAEACYELDEFDEAFKYFKIAYDKGKYRAFQDHEKKYWTFFKQRLEESKQK